MRERDNANMYSYLSNVFGGKVNERKLRIKTKTSRTIDQIYLLFLVKNYICTKAITFDNREHKNNDALLPGIFAEK